MKKKIIFIVLTMYLLFTLTTPIVFAEEKSEQTLALGIFTPEISFEFDKNLTDKPINPLQNNIIDITVKFKLEMSSLSKWFFFNRRIGRLFLFGQGYFLKIKGFPESNLNITLSESPAWCTAKLDTNLFEFSFNDIYNSNDSSVEKTIKLEFMVNKNATAFEIGDIKIQAVFSGIGGINAKTNSINISISVAYVPEIIIETESELIIPPLENTSVPINITNNGNGDSKISISYLIPENWTETFDPESLILKINETKQMNLTVYPPKEFTNQTINFSFIVTPISGLYEGTRINTSINFINDGSLKEEETQNLIIIGIIMLVIILILVFMFLLLRRKKQ